MIDVGVVGVVAIALVGGEVAVVVVSEVDGDEFVAVEPDEHALRTSTIVATIVPTIAPPATRMSVLAPLTRAA